MEKRIIALPLILSMLLSFAACGQKTAAPEKPASAQNETSAAETAAQPATADEWRALYRQELQQLLDGGEQIVGAWVYDVDGDGVPLVALSTVRAIYSMPQLLLNYKAGSLIKKDDIEMDGTGGAVKSEALFCEGTDYLIDRIQGASPGLWSTNRTTLFDISLQDKAYTQADSFSVDTTEMEEEAMRVYERDPDAVDAAGYAKKIADETDSWIREHCADRQILNYADEMTSFITDGYIGKNPEQMRAAVGYLEHALGIDLELDESLYAAEE